MPTVILTKDNKPLTIFGMRDFLYLVDEYMGMKCRNYLSDYIRSVKTNIEDALLADFTDKEDRKAAISELQKIVGNIENEVGR